MIELIFSPNVFNKIMNMTERVIDIRHPQIAGQPEIKRISQKTIAGRKHSVKKTSFWIIGIIVIAALVLGYFTLSQATIEIWPVTTTVETKERVEIDTNNGEFDLARKILPGKIFEESLTVSQSFTASGRAEKSEKAKGVIQVYNAYSDVAQALVANTRFISAEGKLFRSANAATIPGGKYDGKGKLTPGFVDVEVVAAEAGEEYNIGLSTFSIPGFFGTPKYTSFYGKSFSPIAGGSVKEVAQVTQFDLDKARLEITDKLLQESKNLLRQKMVADFMLLDESIEQGEVEINYSVQTGGEAESFNAEAKGHLKVIAFKKFDLENFAKSSIITSLAESSRSDDVLDENLWGETKVQDVSLELDYQFVAIDWQTGKLVLDLSFSAKTYPELQEDVLGAAVSGKRLNEIYAFLGDQANVKESKINLWPFWVQRVPQEKSKIEIKLNLNN